GVVEHGKLAHLGGAQREQQDLNDGDQSHQENFGGIVDAWLGHLDLLHHRHDSGQRYEDFDPRQPVSKEIKEGRSRIWKEVFADDVYDQDIEKPRHDLKSVSPFVMHPVSTDDCGVYMV